jgi:D-glycero-D-manno-heptose 1,7-bisphosphate phosphatase
MSKAFLYIFDLDGTLIEGYINPPQPFERVEPLPQRAAKLAALRADGHIIAIATNQGGVAFGYNSEKDVRAKFARALEALGLPDNTHIAFCFSDARSKDARYNKPEDVARRKPSGAMLREIMAAFPDAAAKGVFYVGDRPEDQAAAADAGVPFMWAADFFGDVPNG